MKISYKPMSVNINGKTHGPIDVAEGMMMLDFLQENLNLTGTRMACGQGICHACVIIVKEPDGSLQTLRTCITGAHFFDNKEVITIEGIAQDSDGATETKTPSPVQKAFMDNFSFQCGYCAPGFVNATTVFIEGLKRNPIPKDGLEAAIEEALNHHICRCTGYVRYYQAVKELVLSTPGLVRD